MNHWLFDLDDTLYPAGTGLFGHVSRRITRRIGSTLGLPEAEARAIQKAYWRKYGTSLRGLMLEHGTDPEPFLADVHDVPVEDVLVPDPALCEMLARLPGRRHVFTNGPSEFVARVLARLGIADLFDEVFDIRQAGFVPKPGPEPYARALARLAALGPADGAIAMVDDSPQNLSPARALGMWTVWLRSPHSVAGGAAGNSVALAADAEPTLTGEWGPHAVIDHLRELEAALAAHEKAR